MPETPATSLLSVQYQCRHFPNDLPEIERQKAVAFMAVSHVGNLGKLLARLTSDVNYTEIPELPAEELQARADELCAGLHVLGTIISAISDAAFGAFEELFEKEVKDGQHTCQHS